MFVTDRRLPWQLIVAAVLLALLATLGTLQYRWLGEVSEAERAADACGPADARRRLRARRSTVSSRRSTWHSTVSPKRLERTPAQAVGAALAKAQAAATVRGLIKDVFLLEAQGARADVLQRYDPWQGRCGRANGPHRSRLARAGEPRRPAQARRRAADLHRRCDGRRGFRR